jgi:ComF family protein
MFLDGIIIVAEQSDLLSYAIHKYKYCFVEGLAGILASKMGYCFSTEVGNSESWVLMPVPLHKKRKKWRGFNQSEMLARELQHYLSLQIDDRLKRIHYKKPQMELNREQRISNIQDAFLYDATGDPHKSVLLIDDVVTTGSTLNECAKILKQAGFKTVYALALTRGT